MLIHAQSPLFGLHHFLSLDLVNLDQSWSGNGDLGDILGGVEVGRRVDEHSDRETVEDVGSEWEVALEGDLTVVVLGVDNCGHDGLVLTVDEDETGA